MIGFFVIQTEHLRAGHVIIGEGHTQYPVEHVATGPQFVYATLRGGRTLRLNRGAKISVRDF